MAAGSGRIKELRYQVMLALYLPILLYSFSTFDLSEQSVAAEKVEPVLVGGQQTVVLGQEYNANAYLKAAQLAKGGEITLRTDDQKVTVQGNENIIVPTAKLLSEGEDQKEVQYNVQMQYDQLEGQASQTLSGSFTVRRPELVAPAPGCDRIRQRDGVTASQNRSTAGRAVGDCQRFGNTVDDTQIREELRPLVSDRERDFDRLPWLGLCLTDRALDCEVDGTDRCRPGVGSVSNPDDSTEQNPRIAGKRPDAETDEDDESNADPVVRLPAISRYQPGILVGFVRFDRGLLDVVGDLLGRCSRDSSRTVFFGRSHIRYVHDCLGGPVDQSFSFRSVRWLIVSSGRVAQELTHPSIGRPASVGHASASLGFGVTAVPCQDSHRGLPEPRSDRRETGRFDTFDSGEGFEDSVESVAGNSRQVGKFDVRRLREMQPLAAPFLDDEIRVAEDADREEDENPIGYRDRKTSGGGQFEHSQPEQGEPTDR